MRHASAKAMMIARLPPFALSDLHPGLRLAGPARPLIGVEKRGTAGAATRGRRAAPRHSAAPAGLGRPRGPRHADPAPAQKAAGAPAGHPRSPGSGPIPAGRDGRRSAVRSPRRSSGSPPRTTAGGTSGSRASCSSSATGSARPRSAGFSRRSRQQRQPSGQPDEHQIQHPYPQKPAILPAERPSPLAYSQVSYLYTVLEPHRDAYPLRGRRVAGQGADIPGMYLRRPQMASTAIATSGQGMMTRICLCRQCASGKMADNGCAD